MFLCRRDWRVLIIALLAACSMAAPGTHAQRIAPELAAPIEIYTHASVPAVHSAASPPGETVALGDLDQLVRLKSSGLRIDYDLLDASAIAPDGLHSAGRTAAWPDGPDAWIARCRAAGIQPGLRFSASALRPNGRAPALFEAESLRDFIPALQSWYDRGVRLFAFDDFDLAGATPESAAGLTQNEIVARNLAALRVALTAFRAKNRGAVLLAMQSSATDPDATANLLSGSGPPVNNLDLRNEASRDETNGLGAFLLLSTGPPRASTLPQASLQRAIDIETDGQVRRDEQMKVPLAHILSAGFIAAPANAASPGASSLPRGWKGEFLLSMARGGWVNMFTGNIASMQTADARWMARVQKLFFGLQAQGQMHSFGGSPSSDQPYCFAGATSRGAVYVVVNPSQAVATLPLPALVHDHPPGAGRVLFRDAGFSPRITGNAITLGPGQMAAVGFGAYAAPEFNFGVQQDVVIPSSIAPVDADFDLTASGVLEARINPPIEGVLRIVVLEREAGGKTQSGTAAGAPAAGSRNRFTLEITQAGRPIPLRPGGVESDGDSTLSTQPSWAVAEIDINDLTPGIPLRVRFQSNEDPQAKLEGSAYQVIY